MSDSQFTSEKPLPVTLAGHAHPGDRRCCGRPVSEKCSPEEEAVKTGATGGKTCCKGHHKQ